MRPESLLAAAAVVLAYNDNVLIVALVVGAAAAVAKAFAPPINGCTAHTVLILLVVYG